MDSQDFRSQAVDSLTSMIWRWDLSKLPNRTIRTESLGGGGGGSGMDPSRGFGSGKGGDSWDSAAASKFVGLFHLLQHALLVISP